MRQSPAVRPVKDNGILDRRALPVSLIEMGTPQTRTYADDTPGVAFRLLLRTDGSRRLLHINDACRDLFGLSPSDIKADDDDFLALYAAEERAAAASRIADASRVLVSWDEEKKFIHRLTGETRWGRTIARPRRLNNGDTLWNGLIVDITERKAAETARLASEERTRRILETALDAVLTMDHQGLLTDWNGQAESIFGWSRDEVLGRPLAEIIIPPRLRANHVAGLARYLDTGEAVIIGRRVEMSALRRDGSEFPSELSITPLRLDDGSVVFSGFVRDLTESKRIQAQMAQREKLAALGEMVAGVAHEINNPLAAISGMCQILQMHPDPQVAEDGRAIRAMTERAVRIVRSLKTFSGQQCGERKPRAIMEVIQIALDIAHFRLSEYSIETEIIVAPDLPLAPMDGNQIEQAVLNLVVNAADAVRTARPIGDGRIRIEADLWTPPSPPPPSKTAPTGTAWVCVRISDNGDGIANEALNRIFDPFFTTKDIGEGTGLGLSICHGILRDHHGHLTAANGPHDENGLTGAVFTLLLPVA